MFDTATQIIEPNRVTRYRISDNRAVLSYSNVLDLWQTDQEFRTYLITVLHDSPFSAYRWETPAVSQKTIDRPFEFVLINTPGFATRRVDSDTYAEYFTDDDADAGIVVFPNLRHDATLIVPSPRTSDHAYGHLAAFIRNAPEEQIHSMWCCIGKEVRSLIGTNSLWVSTAGGGVAWLHVRLDSRPKYYGHTPYKIA